MRNSSVPEASQSLKKNGKTFWLASLFLPRQVAADATTLYAFCRRMDDLADQPNALNATEELDRVRGVLRAGRSEQPVVLRLIKLAECRGLDLRAAECLLDVLLQDASADVRIQDETELLRYCYGAAGTVGLMMFAVLQASGSAAKVQAIDLGIAMQLTNIARDVQEDARMGRRYLPAAWVGDLSPEEIAGAKTGSREAEQIKPAIEKILALADVFYASGALKTESPDIPARRGIRIAASVYRQIGVELRGRGCDFTRGRVVVSLPKKLRIAATVIAGNSELERLDGSARVENLHVALAGLPGFA
jgi:phytoene synthase